jgi:hypothetical protein
LRDFLPSEAIWDRDEAAAGRVNLPIDVEEYSYRWAFDYAGLCTSVARMYRWADRRPPTLQRFVDAIQWYQGMGLRYCAETYRRRRFASFAGARTWSYRENVPGIKFTVVDHRQRPKMGYFGLAAGYEPVLLSVDDQYPLSNRVAGSRYVHDLWVVNDTTTEVALTIDAGLHAVDGSPLAAQRFEVVSGPDSGLVAGRLDLPLPDATGPVLLRATATASSGDAVTSSDTWINVVRPAFEPAVRLLLLGQARYNHPILDAFDGFGGFDITVVDEIVRDPQDSGWTEGLADRFDAVWFSGWDAAIHYFRASELAAIAEATRAGVGFIHTGGQASFHGGDGRGAQLDVTPLTEVLPVTMRPHEGVWDLIPSTVAADGLHPIFDLPLEEMPFQGYSRTSARAGTVTHWRIGDHPLLVTGQSGAGRTAIFTGYLTKPLRMFRVGEGLDWEDPLDVEPHWARADIRAYGPYWPGLRELCLALLAWVTGHEQADVTEIAEVHRAPLYERLTGLAPTRLEAVVEPGSLRDGLRGWVRVTNAGDTIARLVRGVVQSTSSNEHRFLDGFFDLLPGQSRVLRFEVDQPGTASAVALSAQNAAPVVAGVGE